MVSPFEPPPALPRATARQSQAEGVLPGEGGDRKGPHVVADILGIGPVGAGKGHRAKQRRRRQPPHCATGGGSTGRACLQMGVSLHGPLVRRCDIA